ncbi:sigma-54 dependent transcriptional regulator [Geobacter anodireducens]
MAWLGNTDLRAVTDEEKIGLGPVAQAVVARNFERLVLLSNYGEEEVDAYLNWLKTKKDILVTVRSVQLTSPTDFGEIYQAVRATLEAIKSQHGADLSFTFHLSPGTPAMAAVWILLAKSIYPAELLESSREQGVKTAVIPFDISAEFIPALFKGADERLEKLSAGLPPDAPEFSDIIHRSPVMQQVIARARRVALRSIPVLIEGESGTGKELLAKAIHHASPRHAKPIIAVNCGAIPADLVESEIFGHKKGAFTGAVQDKKGYFEAAHGGTLFLDEIGELPLTAQVKILRALQEKEVVPVGGTERIKVDVRIITATNRNLVTEVAEGRFRQDLYYRLAVAVLHLPPLREREGDLSLLIDHMLDMVNRESADEPGYASKKISASARNLMLSYPWPGNARELLNVIQRVAVWSVGETISDDDMREILVFPPPQKELKSGEVALGKGVNLPEILAETARLHLAQAMKESGGNKSKAARLLGLPNYQTLTNWLEKYGVKE